MHLRVLEKLFIAVNFQIIEWKVSITDHSWNYFYPQDTQHNHIAAFKIIYFVDNRQ